MGIIQEVICPLNYHVLRYEICCGYMQECYNNYMNQPLKAQASSHSCCKVIYATHPISNVSASPTFFFTPTQHMTSPSSHEVLFPSSSSSYTLLSLKIPIHSETRKGGGVGSANLLFGHYVPALVQGTWVRDWIEAAAPKFY